MTDDTSGANKVIKHLKAKMDKIKLDDKKLKKKSFELDMSAACLVEKSVGKIRPTIKTFPFSCFKEVQNVCRPDVLSIANRVQNKSAKKDSKQSSSSVENAKLEEKAFTVFCENFDDSLYLIAPDKETKEKWMTALQHVIENKGTIKPNVEVHFRNADKNNDKKITNKELVDYLESINLKLNKIELKKFVDKADRNRDGVLDEEEFSEFFKDISSRTELYDIFTNLASEIRLTTEDNVVSDSCLTVEEFQEFLHDYQHEDKSIDECKALISKYEPNDDIKNQNKLSFVGFDLYLHDSPQHLMNPEHEKVYQRMDLPLNNYYINSSHNTYLSGDQLQSDSKVDCYISVLKSGCRLLEIDVHDGDNGIPVVNHKFTLTSKIKFEDVIIAVKNHAFDASNFSVILTLENSCSKEQDTKVAKYIYQHLKDVLYLEPANNITELPSPDKLKGKVLIRGKKKYELSEKNENWPQSTSDLINIFQTSSFTTPDDVLSKFKPFQGSSIKENDALEFVKKDYAKIIQVTNKFVMKVYPSGIRVDSSNYDPILFWYHGFQIVALNFQKKDDIVSLNKGLFNDNGNCGYVLKPRILNDPMFNPNVKNTSFKMQLDIRIISAQRIPLELSKDKLVTDISDTYVVVTLYGLPVDYREFKTTIKKNNGFNPIWNEDMQFMICYPEFSLIKFTVKDKDKGTSDDILGEYSIRVENMRGGFRHLSLQNRKNQGSLFVFVDANWLNDEFV